MMNNKYSRIEEHYNNVINNLTNLEQSDKDILFNNNLNKNIKDFNIALEKVITLQVEKNIKIINLNFIYFPKENDSPNIYSWIINILGEKSSHIKEIHFWGCHFYSEVIINKVIIKHKLHFGKASFHQKVNFNKSIFKKRVDFLEVNFKQEVSFMGTKFKGEAHFWKSKVSEGIKFNSMEATSIFSINELSFNKIDLEGAIFNKVNMLRIQGFKNNVELEINENNFHNKESARLIKLHFETEKNITEANKFFKIEQELYLKELKSFPRNGNISTQSVLYLNKFVSNFGTDWIRSILTILIFSFFVSFVYNLFDIPKDLKLFKDISYSDKLLYNLLGFIIFLGFYLGYILKKIEIKIYFLVIFILFIVGLNETKLLNDITLIMNPLNMFKSKDYFEHIALFGIFVKLIISVLLYQFIMAFRNNTRRK